MRKEEIKRKKKMLADLLAGKKPQAKKQSKKKEVDSADVNKDGKVDEKDIEAVKKRIKKKKD